MAVTIAMLESMIDEPSVNYLAGQFAVDVLRLMPRPIDRAKPFHDAVQAALVRAGFDTRREAYVGIRESRRGAGYIDAIISIPVRPA